MAVAPSPAQVDFDLLDTADAVVIYQDATLTLQRDPGDRTGAVTAVLAEPVTAKTYLRLFWVLARYAPRVAQLGSGDSIGGWLFLEFSPKPADPA